MTEPSNTTPNPDKTTPDASQLDNRRDWLRALVGIVAFPRTSFEIIRHRTPWLGALLLVVAGTMAMTSLSWPFGLEVTRAQLTERMPPEEVDAMMAQFEQTPAATRWLATATGPAMVAIGLLVQAVFVWLLAVAFQGQSRFAQSLSLMLHLGVIAHLKNWANFLLLHLRGMDAIRSQRDLQAPMGLDLLAGDNAALNAVYSSINPFTIWLLALLGLGAAAVFQLPQRKGFLLAGIYWAATTALAAAAATLTSRLIPT